QAEDGIRDRNVTEVQTCALPICRKPVFASDLALLLLRTSRHGHHKKNEKPESQARVQRAHDLLSRRVPFTLSGDGSGCGIKSVAAGSSSEHPPQHLARCEISGVACWGSSGVLAELLIDHVLQGPRSRSRRAALHVRWRVWRRLHTLATAARSPG